MFLSFHEWKVYIHNKQKDMKKRQKTTNFKINIWHWNYENLLKFIKFDKMQSIIALVKENFMKRKLPMSTSLIPEGLLRLDYHHTLPTALPNQSNDIQQVFLYSMWIWDDLIHIHTFKGNYSYSVSLKSGNNITFSCERIIDILKTLKDSSRRSVMTNICVWYKC